MPGLKYDHQPKTPETSGVFFIFKIQKIYKNYLKILLQYSISIDLATSLNNFINTI